MASKKSLQRFDIAPEMLEAAVQEVLGDETPEDLPGLYEDSIKNFNVDTIIKGTIIKVLNNEVLVDIGYKSEGIIPSIEFDSIDEVKVGDEIEILLETIEDDSGEIVLSKRKADRIRGWERIVSTHKEGDIVTGKAIRKIKGGLLVDIGVPVFLPASQVSIRRSKDIADYIDKELECKIIKIDESRMNIVVSRRKLIEEQRARQRDELLSELEEGQIRKGVVKNIADFGAFVDLGGIDGLLHITDMSWGRVGHPSEVVSIDEEIDVMVLKFDPERGRIALGIKQKSQSPWLTVKERYPINAKVEGSVVNLMPYGAFVKLEDGIEGLVHISEMSWTRRINHPSEMVNIDDVVEVVILEINVEKQNISLGIKQTDVNPWDLVEQRYPEGTIIEGTVRNITSYGAFVEIEEGIDGLLHVSDMSWTKKINHPSERLKKGERVKAVILTVDPNKKRVALGIKQLKPDPWLEEIPDRYSIGEIVNGVVTKITNFGVFVELEEGLEGLLHISELSSRKVNSPEEVVKVGKPVDVRILKVDPQERKLGLSMIDVEQPIEGEIIEKEKKQEEETAVQVDEAVPVPMEEEPGKAVEESAVTPSDTPSDTPREEPGTVVEGEEAGDIAIAPTVAPAVTPSEEPKEDAVDPGAPEADKDTGERLESGETPSAVVEDVTDDVTEDETVKESKEETDRSRAADSQAESTAEADDEAITAAITAGITEPGQGESGPGQGESGTAESGEVDDADPKETTDSPEEEKREG